MINIELIRSCVKYTRESADDHAGQMARDIRAFGQCGVDEFEKMVNERTAAVALHADVLKAVEGLMLNDPEPSTTAGKALLALVSAVETYEKTVYPI